jgi:hypothetical protein
MPRDANIRDKFTRDLSFARQLAKDYFQRFPEEPLPDRGRDLAPDPISKYRVYDEAATRAGQTGMLREPTGWQRQFDEPIELPRGRQLVTLEDAGNYITKLPKAEHEVPEWQAATQALMLVARGGPPCSRASASCGRSTGTSSASSPIAKTRIGAGGS